MTDYPITYQRETAPSWLNYAAALGGGGARDLTRRFRYLELGCGRGYSALLHAAAHPTGEFVAIDRDEVAKLMSGVAVADLRPEPPKAVQAPPVATTEPPVVAPDVPPKPGLAFGGA